MFGSDMEKCVRKYVLFAFAIPRWPFVVYVRIFFWRRVRYWSSWRILLDARPVDLIFLSVHTYVR